MSARSRDDAAPREVGAMMLRSAKVLLLGDIGVGKTSIARRLAFNTFEATYKTTIGVDVVSHEVDLGPTCDNARIRLVLWDTDGDFGQKIFTTVYATGSTGAVIVADASRPETFAKLRTLSVEFNARFPGRPMRAIVNKIDLVPPPERAFSVPDMQPSEIWQGSAKTGEGIGEIFLSIGQAIWRRS
jgi:Ras-related protein Rab-5C